jgi:hypothetical protein
LLQAVLKSLKAVLVGLLEIFVRKQEAGFVSSLSADRRDKSVNICEQLEKNMKTARKLSLPAFR